MTQLTNEEVRQILNQAQSTAKKEASLLRVDASGEARTTRMHIVVVNREGRVIGQNSMEDAWMGSIAIARGKAFTAVAFSSNENALSTRAIGILSQPGGALWQIGNSNTAEGIIEFPGGLPLYKNGELAGAIGVSGDGVDQDENVAVGGSAGFEAPVAIRVDNVTKGGIKYTGGAA